MSESLRQFNEVHIEQDCSELSGHHENELFYGCTFRKLNGLTLQRCCLDNSKFLTESLRDSLGFTITLDCHSFSGVEYSPLLFDLLLVLMTMSSGNDEKRRKLVEVIGHERYDQFVRVLKAIE